MSLAEEAARHVEAQIVHDAALELLASHLGSAAQLAGVHVLDVRERDTILAALHHWQEKESEAYFEWREMAASNGPALTWAEIDALCERLNGI